MPSFVVGDLELVRSWWVGRVSKVLSAGIDVELDERHDICEVLRIALRLA